jgi:DNA helicase II / ATP-dependent DNA helicase PcrA
MPDVLDQLNDEQRNAALQIEGPQLILAGAGSGKTRTVTHKIAWMIEENIDPSSILAITFTNKAANEMKSRINTLVGEDGSKVTAKTFHSFCYQILRKSFKLAGLKANFSIYTDKEQRALYKGIFADFDDRISLDLRTVISEVSKAKNDMVSPETLVSQAANVFDQEIAFIYDVYQKRLITNNAVDFDDLLILANNVLEDKAILEYWQDRYKYIFVDEFQDTNKPQFLLVEKLSKKHGNICVVGDDNQSIYGWRGSNIQYIIDFATWFPGTKEYKLETNYRSTPTIIEGASKVIDLNSNKTDKKLVAFKERSRDLINVFIAETAETEARKVVGLIQKNLRKYKPEDIAILYRTNYQSRVLEETLRTSFIPYTVLGGLSFYDRKEIKDIVSYLKVISNKYDSVALERIINFPPRKIGKVSIDKVKQEAVDQNISLWDACKKSSSVQIHGFVLAIEDAKKITDLYKLVSYILKTFGIQKYWEKSKNTEAYENVMEFTSIVKQNGKETDLDGFLEFIALMGDKSNDSAGVRLMTAHASKGLEFPVVFIVGLGENIFPLKVSEHTDLEEERRLFYVALTRAEDIAYLSYPRSRFVYGEHRSYEISHFITEIPVILRTLLRC